jgi:hypothetical protein
MSKEQDKDETINRLIQENSNLNKAIREAKYEMTALPEIEGLSLTAGIKLLVKMYIEAKKNEKPVDKSK